MSYILEALKKADQERTLGSVPDLETPHWGARRAARNYRWLWVVGALLLLNGVLLAFLLGRGTDDDEPRAIAPAVSSSEPQPVLPVVPVTPIPGAGTTIVTRPRTVIQPIQAPVQPPRVTQATEPLQAGTTPPAIPAVAPQRAAVPQPAARPPRQGVQLWSDLPLEFRSSFSLPHIDVHVYADQPARRFILVDLQKYREGDTLESGAVIEGILPHGLQLYYQGTRFEVEK
jgi:general secretion pathway protein B